MNTWNFYRNSLDLISEPAAHPDTRGIKAELYSCPDSTGTEVEFLDLLNSFIVSTKPSRILETGTYKGIGTAALAYGLKYNFDSSRHEGHLISLETDNELAQGSIDRIKRCGLDSFVTIKVGSSVETLQSLESTEGLFDLVFFDSSRPIRPLEFEVLHKRHLLSPSALLVFHDTATAPVKASCTEAVKQTEYRHAIEQIVRDYRLDCISLEMSRGLTIIQYSNQNSDTVAVRS